jgi:hypothetical protein
MTGDGNDPKLCKEADPDDLWGTTHPRDIWIQIALSLTLGLGAFLTFCVSVRATTYTSLWLTLSSFFALGGRACTPRVKNKARYRPRSQSFPIAFSVGYYRYGE